MSKYFLLSLTIILEVIGTMALKLSEGYTKLVPTIVMASSYSACFYFFSKCLNQFNSVGYVYAIWAGFGIFLITLAGIIFFHNQIDLAGIIGLSLIVLGAVVLNLFSNISH